MFAELQKIAQKFKKKMFFLKLFNLCSKTCEPKEGLLAKIDFGQSWAIFMKNPITFKARRKMEVVASHFWAHNMHVKELS